MRKQRGFTLIELLIVVAIIGIIAAIAIPNLLDAIERSRQKRTVADIRSMAGACQAYSTDYGGYPRNALSGDPNVQWITDVDAVNSPTIVPDLIQAAPSGDGWRRPYTFSSGPNGVNVNPQLGQLTAANFILYSLGNDGGGAGGTTTGAGDATTAAANLCVTPQAPFGTAATFCYQDDILWCNSGFVQAPEGKQKNC